MRSASLPALRGFATMMWQSVGSRPGMTAANSFVWPNGAPDALSRPIAYCWTSSGSIRELGTCTVRVRTTRYVPLVIQPRPSSGVNRTILRVLADVARCAAGSPCIRACRRGCLRRHQVALAGLAGGRHGERAEQEVLLRRRGDAGLVRPVERLDVGLGACR